jgi:hypothetical protein
MGFEPKIPVFKQTKEFHALDRVATVIGPIYVILIIPLTQLPHFMQLDKVSKVTK